MRNFLSKYPDPDVLTQAVPLTGLPRFRECNAHIHTPYSFSAFQSIGEAFALAAQENIKVLGINDFFVTDGFAEFADHALASGVFPLFNIEFIGLMQEEQLRGIRINDPINPGRIYLTGKALDFPAQMSVGGLHTLETLKMESQEQIRAMLGKLNERLQTLHPSLYLGYDAIRQRFAKDLVRERHLARALRVTIEEKIKDPSARTYYLRELYGGKECKADLNDNAALENELRSNLLKAGGAAFVEEDENSFRGIEQLIALILDAGGIPCYPVLLDDPQGKTTEFEADPETLWKNLRRLGIGCIELIPQRNAIQRLRPFVDFFRGRGFIILFGTEHNTPEMSPLTPTARHASPLDESLKETNWEGACVLAAHQYMRARGLEGFPYPANELSPVQIKTFAETGRGVIETYLNHDNHEA